MNVSNFIQFCTIYIFIQPVLERLEDKEPAKLKNYLKYLRFRNWTYVENDNKYFACDLKKNLKYIFIKNCLKDLLETSIYYILCILCYSLFLNCYISIIFNLCITTTTIIIIFFHLNLMHIKFSIKYNKNSQTLWSLLPLILLLRHLATPSACCWPPAPGRGRALHLRRVSALAYLLMKSTTSWHETPRSLTQEWEQNRGREQGRWQHSESLLNFAQLINLSPRPGCICRWLTLPLIGPQIEGS